jgi:hypothetical protein
MIQFYALKRNVNPQASSSIHQVNASHHHHSSKNDDGNSNSAHSAYHKAKKRVLLEQKNRTYRFDWLRSTHHRYMCEQRCLLLMERTSPFNMMNPKARRWLAAQV